MRIALRRLLPAILLVGAAIGQTTGVVNKNDLTINTLGSATTSCTTLCFPTPVTLTHRVSTTSGNFVIFLFSFCPCVPCSMAMGNATCTPVIPMTACGLTTNQSVDLLFPNTACPLFNLGSAIAVGGIAQISWNVPFLGPPCVSGRGSTQALIFDPCAIGNSAFPGPFLMTQAYTLNF
jgi:hypothetical protein